MVYDITNERTFERAQDWIKELNENAEVDIVIALVGNKTDLEDKREISTQKGKDYAK